ncbi:MAG TPA: HlyD family efflux transporter periplasmic adaptor subunit [Gemmatimonadaceae bacterium]|nr:HlyD family efflux transporter periplasmic adaptor subunit [Gemmatimonadaceae bacterium]
MSDDAPAVDRKDSPAPVANTPSATTMPLEPTVIPKRLAPERGNGAGATVEPEESSAEREVRVDELPSPHPKKLRRYLPLVLAAIAASLAVRAGVRWWQARKSALPSGIVYGNGRLEADEIDIDTKFAGRVATLYVNEGDLVHAGQAVARMDTRDLEASRRTAMASARQAARLVDEMRATIAQQRTEVALAKKELDRYQQLVDQDYVTREAFDQRQQAYEGAVAALSAAVAKLHEAQQAHDAAQHVVELADVNIRDDTLVAPRDARVQYRIANVGEVLPAGGKIFTLLDATSVYMDIYLPTADAGRVFLGADSRILLDAYPTKPIKAAVSFLATEAQFTPKAVETKSDRDKLMFRVKLRIDSTLLRGREAAVRTGLPGVGYVRVDSGTAWPPQLRGRDATRPAP